MKKKCSKCKNIIILENNPRDIKGAGIHRRPVLCDECWRGARCGADRTGDKRYGKRGSSAGGWINTKSMVLGGQSKASREAILIRNKEIDRLRKRLDEITKENIMLNDELKCLQFRGGAK